MRVKSLKTHDIQIFVPGVATLKGIITEGTSNECTVEMDLDKSTGFVSVTLKKGGATAYVELSPSCYAFAVVDKGATVTPIKK